MSGQRLAGPRDPLGRELRPRAGNESAHAALGVPGYHAAHAWTTARQRPPIRPERRTFALDGARRAILLLGMEVSGSWMD